MAGRRAGAALALAALALSAAACGGTKTVTVIRTHTVTTTQTVTVTTTSAAISACTGDQLSGTFKEAPGGGGAGQIEYVLTLTNTSAASCTLGVQKLVLLGASDTPLPTNPSGPLPAGVLAPGAAAHATARFSPDVPGSGDSQSGSCQPKAFGLQVTPNGGGVVNAPVKPPTSVCEQGSLSFSSG